MRLAILGGSFNPVHLAHLALCDEVLAAFDYDLLLLIPSYQNPLKAKARGASDEDRLSMLVRAVSAHPKISVDDTELRRKGLSYTIDTIDELERRYKVTGKIGLVLGDDLSGGFSGWHRAGELASRCDLILARRLEAASPFPYPHKILENPLLEISSTALRSRIESGAPWSFWVPAAVRRYIFAHGLYGYHEPWAAEIEKVEAEALRSLSLKRYQHSRGVAQLAAILCERFEIERSAGYLAGIAHDVCKELPHEKLRELALADGHGISELEERKLSLLHARAAATFLEREMAITNPSILEAVRLHTFGAPNMGSLAKIVYIADKIEPSRLSVDPALREAAWQNDLEDLFHLVMRSTADFLLAEGKEVAASTWEILGQIEGEKR